MKKIIKSNSRIKKNNSPAQILRSKTWAGKGNSLIILLIFLMVVGWIFSGWPQIWQKPSIPSEIQFARAAVTTYQFQNYPDGSCSKGNYTSYIVTPLLSPPWDFCRNEDKIKITSAVATDLLLGYLNNGGYASDYIVTGQASGNEITVKSKNTDATLYIKLVEVNPSNGAIITILGTYSEAVLANQNYTTNPDLSGLSGTVSMGNTFGFLISMTPTGSSEFEIKFGAYNNSGKQVLISVDETPVSVVSTTLGDGTDPGNSIVAPGTTNNYLDQFTFVTDSGTDEVTALTVTSVNTVAIASVEIWNEGMSTQYFSTESSPVGDDWNFSGGIPIPVNTSLADFRIIFTAEDHTTLADGTYPVIGTVTSFTCSNPTAGTDTDGATITVDNTPPANATWGTISPGYQQIELNWTNPGDADFYRVLILRNTVSITDTPTEGTEYSVNDPIGSSIVRYIGGGTTFTDTGLTNGIDYYYKIFSYDTYINYAPGVGTGPHIPQAVAVTTFTQDDFRWYDNADSVQPGTAKAAENTAITGVTNSEILRMRMNILVGTADLGAGSQAFKLQYGQGSDCTAIGAWNDVDAISGGGIWRGYNNTPADGATISSTLLTASDVNESYEEENNSVSNPNAITNGQQGEWDWVVENNGASDSTTYCFRMVESDGTALGTYNSDSYPKLTTAVVVSPATYRAPEDNSATYNTTENIRLRIQITNTGSVATDYDYLLEYAQKSGGICGDDESFTAVSVAAGADDFEMVFSDYETNDVADGDSTTHDPSDFSTPGCCSFVSGRIVADTSSGDGSGSNSSGAFTLQPNEYTEFEFVFKATGAASGDYCFRLTNAGADLNDYSVYPELTITP